MFDSLILSIEIQFSMYSECLDRVNMYRNVHGSDDLELDKKLCSKAQDWAEKLAKKDGLEHASKETFEP